MSRGGDPVQEVVVTGVRPYTPPSAGPGYLVSPNTGPVYRGPANGNAALQQICSNIEVTFSSCNLNAQNMYTQNTSNCRYGVVGGAIVGGIGITGATMMTGGWALLPLGIGGIGAGTTAWGASSCYNDQVSIRDSNYAICTSNLAKDKRMCGQ